MKNQNVDRLDLFWVLGSLCQFFRIPFAPEIIEKSFPPPRSLLTLLQAAQALGLTLGPYSLNRGKLASLPLPWIALFREEKAVASKAEGGEFDVRAQTDPETAPAQPAHATGALVPALVVRLDGERVLYFRPGQQSAKTLPIAEIQARFEPTVWLVRRSIEATAVNTDPANKAAVPDAVGAHKFGFRWFAPELLRHKRIWRDVLLASAAIQLVGLSTPLFTQVIIDKVVVHHTRSTLLVVALALVMFMLFNAVMTWLRQYLILHTGNRIDAVLGAQVFRHLLRVPMPFFAHRPTGVLVARLHGVETIREFLSGAAVSLLLDLPFVFIFLAVMFWYSWQLTLIASGILMLIAALSLVVAPVFRARLNRQFLLGARNQAFLTEYLAGIETVKSLQMEPVLEGRYGDYLATYLASGFSTRQLGNTYNVLANALEQTMTLSILVAGALLVMRSDGFTVGMLVAFQMFAARLGQPVLRLVGLWQEFQNAAIAVRRLGDVMDVPEEPHALIPSRVTGNRPGAIVVEDLAFRYSCERPHLFRDLNISLLPGKLTAVMGPSGSGKSTLAKLLQGFYQPTDGRITLDGCDIRHLSANELRGHFGVVPQETVLFSGTLYDNLILANPNAGFDDVVQACKLAEIHDVIERLPQGYRTEIGEHGVGLSGGQKQRIAIARALLKRPKILIFDEATSSLDSPTAEAFARTVNRLKGKVTVLFIAHQVPRALQVDHVVRIGERMAVVAGEREVNSRINQDKP